MENQRTERRKDKRLPIEMKLEVSQIFKQDYIVMNDIHADISVYDISKMGIGFFCKEDLPIDYYFNGKIVLGDASMFFYAVVKIIRKGKTDETGEREYGAEFVGLAPFLGNKVDQYAKKIGINIMPDNESEKQ